MVKRFVMKKNSDCQDLTCFLGANVRAIKNLAMITEARIFILQDHPRRDFLHQG